MNHCSMWRQMFMKDQLFVLTYVKVRDTQDRMTQSYPCTLLSYVTQLQRPMQGRASREDLDAARTHRLVGEKMGQKWGGKGGRQGSRNVSMKISLRTRMEIFGVSLCGWQYRMLNRWIKAGPRNGIWKGDGEGARSLSQPLFHRKCSQLPSVETLPRALGLESKIKDQL